MDADDVGVPQGQVGKLLRHNFLHFAAERFPFTRVAIRLDHVHEFIDAHIAVMAAVGADLWGLIERIQNVLY